MSIGQTLNYMWNDAIDNAIAARSTLSCWNGSSVISPESSKHSVHSLNKVNKFGANSKISQGRKALERRYRRRLDASDANNPDRVAKDKEIARRRMLGPDERFLEDSGDVKEYRRRVAQKMMKAVNASDHKHLKLLYKTAGELHSRYLPSDEALVHCARTESGEMTCAKILLPWCYLRTMLKALQIGIDRREADVVRLLLECKESKLQATDPVGWLDRTSMAEQRRQKKGDGAGATRGAPEVAVGVTGSTAHQSIAEGASATQKYVTQRPSTAPAATAGAGVNSSFISKDSIINGVGDKRRSASKGKKEHQRSSAGDGKSENKKGTATKHKTKAPVPVQQNSQVTHTKSAATTTAGSSSKGGGGTKTSAQSKKSETAVERKERRQAEGATTRVRTLGACLIRAVPQAMGGPMAVLGKILTIAVDANDLRLAAHATALIGDPDVCMDEANRVPWGPRTCHGAWPVILRARKRAQWIAEQTGCGDQERACDNEVNTHESEIERLTKEIATAEAEITVYRRKQLAAKKIVDASAPEVEEKRQELAEKEREIPRVNEIINAVNEIRAWLAREAEEMDAILANCTTEQRVLDEARALAPREPLQRWAVSPEELFERIRRPGVGKRHGDSGELGEYPIMVALKVHPQWASHGPDKGGNLMLHLLCRPWIERGCKLSPELMETVVNAYPAAAAHKDNRYKQLPLHAYCVATSKLEPRQVATLCKAYPAGAATEDNAGNLPLHCVFLNRNPKVKIHAKSINALVTANHKSVVTQRSSDGSTPLHLLCKSKMVQHLGPFELAELIAGCRNGSRKDPGKMKDQHGKLAKHYLPEDKWATPAVKDAYEMELIDHEAFHRKADASSISTTKLKATVEALRLECKDIKMEIQQVTVKTKHEWEVERDNGKLYKLGTFKVMQMKMAITEHEQGIVDARERRAQIFGFRMVHFLQDWLDRLQPGTECDLPREVALGKKYIAEGGKHVEGTVYRDWRKQRATERTKRDNTIRGPHVMASRMIFDPSQDNTRPDQDFYPQSEIVKFFDNDEYNRMIGISPYTKEVQEYADQCAKLKATADEEGTHFIRGKSKPVHDPKVHRWCEGVPM